MKLFFESLLEIWAKLDLNGCSWCVLCVWVVLVLGSGQERPSSGLLLPVLPAACWGAGFFPLHLNDLPDTQPEGLLLLALGFSVQIRAKFVLEPARSQQKGAHASAHGERWRWRSRTPSARGIQNPIGFIRRNKYLMGLQFI